MGTDMTLKIQSNWQKIIIFLYKYVPRHQSASEDTDFTAIADMNRMILNEKGDGANVPIEITSKRSNSSLKYNGKNKYLEVSLEDLMKRRFIITADTSGKVADGYALGEVTVTNPNVLNVSGPASIVKQNRLCCSDH